MPYTGLRIAGWGFALALWLAPAVAMQFTDEMLWGPLDFAVFGTMILLAGGALELAGRASASLAYRAAMGVAVGAAFLMVWANLAVGIIGDEGNPANLMFFAILALGVAGAALVRMRARGMAVVMVAMAAAQGFAGVAGFAALGAEVLLLPFSIAYGAIWLFAAWLFARAADAGGARAIA